MNKMKIRDRIAKLIDVKTIITFALTGTFVYLIVNDRKIPEFFATTYTSILVFYFGNQFKKKENEDEKRD